MFIGKKPAAAPLTSSDVEDGIITNAKLAQDIISADTALGAEPADTDEFLVSDAGVLKRMDYSYIKGGGKINQVVQATKTDTATVNSASFTDLGISAAITPSASSSKVLVLINLAVSTADGSGGGVKLVRGSTDILIGDAASSRQRTSQMTTTSGGRGNMPCQIIYLDSPSSTSETTYKIQAFCESGLAFNLNKQTNDTDNASFGRMASSIVLMEVLA
jgi:hypothetical protein